MKLCPHCHGLNETGNRFCSDNCEYRFQANIYTIEEEPRFIFKDNALPIDYRKRNHVNQNTENISMA